MPKWKVTSIKVDEDLWDEFKIEAIRRKTSVAELLDSLVRRELNSKKGSKPA